MRSIALRISFYIWANELVGSAFKDSRNRITRLRVGEQQLERFKVIVILGVIANGNPTRKLASDGIRLALSWDKVRWSGRTHVQFKPLLETTVMDHTSCATIHSRRHSLAFKNPFAGGIVLWSHQPGCMVTNEERRNFPHS